MLDRFSSNSPSSRDRKRSCSDHSDQSCHSSPMDVPLRFSRPIRRTSISPERRKIRYRRRRPRRNYLSSSSRPTYRSRSHSRDNLKKHEEINEDWWMMETARFLQKIGNSDVSKSQLAPRSPEVIMIDDDDDIPLKPAFQGDVALQRKLLGLMYTLEQEMRNNGRIKKIEPSRLKQIYDELGLHITGSESDRIMKTVMQSFASKESGTKMDLTTFGIEKRPVYDPVPFDPRRPPPTWITAQYGVDSELEKILSGIKSDLAKIETKVDVQSVVQPLANRFTRVQDIYKDEEISFAYDPEKFAENHSETKTDSNELKQMMKKIDDLKNKFEAGRSIEKNKPEERKIPQIMCQGSFPKKPEHKSDKPKFGLPQGFPQPMIQKPKPAVITISEETLVPSLLQGQKIALPRTILPFSVQNAGGANYNAQYVQGPFYPTFPSTSFVSHPQLMPNNAPDNYIMNNSHSDARTDLCPLPPNAPLPYNSVYSSYNANNNNS